MKQSKTDTISMIYNIDKQQKLGLWKPEPYNFKHFLNTDDFFQKS